MNPIRLAVMVVCGGVLVLLALSPLFAMRKYRRFSPEVEAEILALDPPNARQNVVDLVLDDGRTIRDVWVGYGRYPALLAGKTLRCRYRPRDVVHALPASTKRSSRGGQLG